MIYKKNASQAASTANFPYLAKFLNPSAIIGGLDINWGTEVAHFGSGTGFFTLALAQKVGPDGKVYAFDVLKEKLEALASQAKRLGLNNIIVQRANLEKKEGSGLAKESQDWVIIVNMLYQCGQKNQVIKEASRILKKEGHALIIDWKNISASIGPQKNARVSKQEMITMAKKNGFSVQEAEISNFHFGMILEKK